MREKNCIIPICLIRVNIFILNLNIERILSVVYAIMRVITVLCSPGYLEELRTLTTYVLSLYFFIDYQTALFIDLSPRYREKWECDNLPVLSDDGNECTSFNILAVHLCFYVLYFAHYMLFIFNSFDFLL